MDWYDPKADLDKDLGNQTHGVKKTFKNVIVFLLEV